jgi:hypothetical protein
MTIPSKIYLDGHTYFTEKNSYRQSSDKTLSDTISLGTTHLRNEGGMKPDTWDFTAVCLSTTELSNLSGSFIKVTGDTRLAFSGLRNDAHMVYFDSMGPPTAYDLEQTMFRVPCKLSAAEVGD